MKSDILIVDDVHANRTIIRKVIERDLPECNLFEAENGVQALEIVKKQHICVIVLDIVMPEMDGIEVLRQIKSNSLYKEIQVIMCTSVHEIDMVQAALELGALDYFTKPLTTEQVKITLPLKVKNALQFYSQKSELIEYYEKTKDELRLAEKVQKALIAKYSKSSRTEMWGSYLPFEEIGGDMFSFKEFDKKAWFMIADVSGHGISSAMVSTMVNVIFNTTIIAAKSSSEVLIKINKTLAEVFNENKSVLVSAFIGCIENGKLSFANAGHPYPALIKNLANKSQYEVCKLETNGYLLGIMEDANFEEVLIDVNEGDMLLLYTDGLYENGSENSFLKWKDVYKYCEIKSNEISGNEKAFINDLVEHFSKQCETKFTDDVAVMLIKVID